MQMFVPGGGQDRVFRVQLVRDQRPVRSDGLERHAEPRADLQSAIRRAATSSSSAPRRSSATLATRAFRRPLAEEDLAELLEYYRDGVQRQRLRGRHPQRASPAFSRARIFLYRVELPPEERRTPAKPTRSTISTLASKLSFFLWNTIPDDELLELAARGELGDERVLRAPSRADAEGSARGDAREQLRLPLARSEAPGRGRARPTIFPYASGRGDPRADYLTEIDAVREEHLRRGPQRRRLHDGEAHVRERARRAALRHQQRERRPLPARRARRIRRAGACSARARS